MDGREAIIYGSYTQSIWEYKTVHVKHKAKGQLDYTTSQCYKGYE